MEGQLCLVVCESIYDISVLERELKAADIWCDMVPAPRSVTTSCAMGIHFFFEDLEETTNLMETGKLFWQGIYRLDDGKYSLLEQ